MGGCAQLLGGRWEALQDGVQKASCIHCWGGGSPHVLDTLREPLAAQEHDSPKKDQDETTEAASLGTPAKEATTPLQALPQLPTPEETQSFETGDIVEAAGDSAPADTTPQKDLSSLGKSSTSLLVVPDKELSP